MCTSSLLFICVLDDFTLQSDQFLLSVTCIHFHISFTSGYFIDRLKHSEAWTPSIKTILTTILASIDPFWKEVMSLPVTITYFQLTLIISFTLSAVLLEVEVTST